MLKRLHSPGVDDMLLSASRVVAVQHQVTVTSKELSMGGWVHQHFIFSFHTPDLQKITSVTSTHTDMFADVNIQHERSLASDPTWTFPEPSSTMLCWAAMAAVSWSLEASKGI